VRKAQPRRVRTKNGDTQIAHLGCRVSHYKVILDACPGASPISIHWRRAKLERVSHSKTHLRHALIVHVTNLVTG
jgi:hypothetical protein